MAHLLGEGRAAMTTEAWESPRCVHGHILLGCPHDDCPTQSAYLDQQDAAVSEYEQHQRAAARRLVRQTLGLGEDES